MTKIKPAIVLTLLFTVCANTVSATQVYTSSKSNKVSSIGTEAQEEANSLLVQTHQDASTVAKTMITSDQGDGYTGDYEITVNVNVTIKRIPKPAAAK